MSARGTSDCFCEDVVALHGSGKVEVLQPHERIMLNMLIEQSGALVAKSEEW